MLQRGADGEYERVRALGAIKERHLNPRVRAGASARYDYEAWNLEVAEDDYEDFISKLWRRYVAFGLSPDILVEQINQLYFFLEKNENHMLRITSIPHILEYIKTKLEAIKDLESKEQSFQKINMELQIQKETLEAERVI